MEIHSRTNASFTADKQGICMPLVSAMGPAACAAKALSLDEKQTKTALGFGLGCVPITTANLGHDAHFFESAMHGLQGLVGAQLAKEGLTSNPDLKLYKAMMLENASLDDITKDLGSRWVFCDQWIKKYPYFFGMHTFLDALQDIIKEHNITYDQVETIEAHISPFDKKCADRPDPKTDGDVRFSYQHALGAMMLDGKINIANSCAEAAFEPRYKEARGKVKTILHPDHSEHLCFADPSQVDVTLKDGKKLTKTRSILKGQPEEPLSDSEFKDLYRNFCDGILPDDSIQTTMDMIWDLENLSNVEELMRILTYGR
jgi:2-methylcitrate dehydratase PrpD